MGGVCSTRQADQVPPCTGNIGNRARTKTKRPGNNDKQHRIISPKTKHYLQKTLFIRQIFLAYEKTGSITEEDLACLMKATLNIVDCAIHEQVHEHFDKDKNGELDFNEFIAFMLSITPIGKEFKSADQNGDDSISMDELQLLLSNLGIDVQTLARVMEIFDANNNKRLEHGEFMMMMNFLKKLEKVYDKCVEKKSISEKELCSLLDDPDKERIVARHITKIIASGQMEMGEFIKKIVFFKEKIKPKKLRKKVRSNRHNHQEQMGDTTNNEHWHNSTHPDKGNILPPIDVPVTWLRPTEIHPNSELFVDGIDESDVIQGRLHDCWFIGALILVANGLPDRIRDLFVGPNAEGYYTCQFFHTGIWVTVQIDDCLPCEETTNGKELCFARCLTKSEFWVPLIEKAYAKLHGSYLALNSGYICEALKDLTGGATQVIVIEKGKLMKEQWHKILSLYNEKSLLGSVINSEDEKLENVRGLYVNHTYAILDCVEVDGVKFVVLRNPWGQAEWNGDWSDQSEKWTKLWKEKPFVQNYQFKDDGKFYMCFEDFVKYFNRLYVLRTSFGKPKYMNYGVWTKWHCNQRYAITTNEPNTTIIVNLSQPDWRKDYGLNSEQIRNQGKYEIVGMNLCEAVSNNFSLQYHKVKETDFHNTRDTSLEYTFEKASTYVLQLCMTVARDPPQDDTSYFLALYSNSSNSNVLDVKHIPTEKLYILPGEWLEGFHSHARNNERPRYVVQCRQDSLVDIILVPTVADTEMDSGIEMGIKVHEYHNIGYERFAEQEGCGRSLCVSVTVRSGVEYIIEPYVLGRRSKTSFELNICSDYVSKFVPYLDPTPSNANRQCIVCIPI
eukprot:Phypoly_transcript_02855.p1 GENE.Phypoly_transcript_02855~~Phypoly_transcript_02855.p1  ORF type:complete len:842 (+),score=77.87 Phypoly_transcript_02855:108-2633(+)